jgi:uncharacterized membrane protein YozB (DUF420 family)
VIPIWTRPTSQDELAIGLGVAFLALYLVYHAFSGLAKFGSYGTIRPIYFTRLAVHVFMAFVVAALVPVTFYNAMKQRFETHKRFARVTCRSGSSSRLPASSRMLWRSPLSDER